MFYIALIRNENISQLFRKKFSRENGATIKCKKLCEGDFPQNSTRKATINISSRTKQPKQQPNLDGQIMLIWRKTKSSLSL